VKLSAVASSAREVSLLEDGGQELRIVDGALVFNLHPYEIKTFRLKLQPWRER
jgi:hypothetical protein